MEIITINEWDEALWQKAKPIYQEAFGDLAKPEEIIRNMFAKGICQLHLATDGTIHVAMALTGATNGSRVLIIDYLAVRKSKRGQGLGREIFKYIRKWAISQDKYDSILLEAESENTHENRERIHFWEKCGFDRIDNYTHHYMWVPEPYQAMVFELKNNNMPKHSGKQWFKHIEAFHKQSFQQK
jgi:GNAT superfamily N-acetyltransferase